MEMDTLIHMDTQINKLVGKCCISYLTYISYSLNHHYMLNDSDNCKNEEVIKIIGFEYYSLFKRIPLIILFTNLSFKIQIKFLK